jgi:hypothetical protein
MATNTEINEVRKVIYQPNRWRNMQLDLREIAVVMNIEQPPPKCNHPCRNATEPNRGAGICDRLADELLSIRGELAGVRFNSKDKERLRTALLEDARAWRARADAWRTAASNGSTNMRPLQRTIDIHFNASVKAYTRVREYLR